MYTQRDDDAVAAPATAESPWSGYSEQGSRRLPPPRGERYDSRGGGGGPSRRRDEYEHGSYRGDQAYYEREYDYDERDYGRSEYGRGDEARRARGGAGGAGSRHHPYARGGGEGWDEDARYAPHADSLRDAREYRQRDTRASVPDLAPCSSVVFLGLPAHVDADSLQSTLESLGAKLDSATVMKDRHTGLSRRFGFARFASAEHARAFVEPNYPAFEWPASSSSSGASSGEPAEGEGGTIRVRVNYSQRTGGYGDETYDPAAAGVGAAEASAEEGEIGPSSANDGTRDIGSEPTSTLLVRGLDPLTPPDDLVAALDELVAPASSSATSTAAASKSSRAGITRVLTIRDRLTRLSCGFAFVQFSSVASAQRVLARAFDTKACPRGVRVFARVVALSFAHAKSLVPVYARSQWSVPALLEDDPSGPSSSSAASHKVKASTKELAYWDELAFADPYLVAARSSSDKNDGGGDKDVDAFFLDLDKVLAGPAAAAKDGAPSKVADPPSSSGKRRGKEPLPAPGEAAKTTTTKARVDSAPSSSSGKKATETQGTSAGASGGAKAELIYSRKAAGNIAKWNSKQQELKAVGSTETKAGGSSRLVVDEMEHSDALTKICLLCQRQFKTVDDLKRHNKLSDLHKNNLANETTVEEAKARKVAAIKKREDAAAARAANAAQVASAASPAPTEEGGEAGEQPKYVDRAAARREAFNQPHKPKEARWQPPWKLQQQQQAASAPPPPPPPPPTVQPNKDGIQESNVGSKLLEKMGWSKGEGLGTSASGTTTPVIAAQFQQGVGLGASKGVAIGTREEESGSYAAQNRAKARERLMAEDP